MTILRTHYADVEPSTDYNHPSCNAAAFDLAGVAGELNSFEPDRVSRHFARDARRALEQARRVMECKLDTTPEVARRWRVFERAERAVADYETAALLASEP